MERAELGKHIRDVTRRTDREFKLTAGGASTVFYDMKQLLRSPQLFDEVTTALADLVPSETEVIGGIPQGGTPFATAIFLKRGIPQAIIRKDAKQSGTEDRIQGESVQNKIVTLAEDVISTGKSTKDGAMVVQEEGGYPKHVVAILLREETARVKLKEAGITVHVLFTKEELEEL